MIDYYVYDGTLCAVKAACTVWGGGKAGDYIKSLPIAILSFETEERMELMQLTEELAPNVENVLE